MQYFDILLFAVITGVLLIRLHRVLGRRTGHERPPPETAPGPDSQSQAESLVAPEVEPAAEPAEAGPALARGQAGGLEALKAADPAFDPEQFLAGARQAFELIVSAFAHAEREPLRQLLSDSVYRSFENSIVERERHSQVMEVRKLKVVHASIVSAYIENMRAVVRVEFESEKIEVILNPDGTVVDGDPDIPARASDVWTFSRDFKSADPNWALIRTGE